MSPTDDTERGKGEGTGCLACVCGASSPLGEDGPTSTDGATPAKRPCGCLPRTCAVSLPVDCCGTFLDRGTSWALAYAILSILVTHAFVASMVRVNRAHLWTMANAALALLVRECAVRRRPAVWASVAVIGAIDVVLVVLDVVQLAMFGLDRRWRTGDPNVIALGMRAMTVALVGAALAAVAGRSLFLKKSARGHTCDDAVAAAARAAHSRDRWSHEHPARKRT